MAPREKYDASSIKVIDGLDAVRKVPGMYIGSTTRKGLNHLVYEVIDNAVDEHLAGYCTEITVTLNKDGSATVKDNGRGIPVEMHEKGVSAERVVLTTLHAGGKFDSKTYKTSGGLHGVGSSVVNALSEWLDIKISRDGKIHHDSYKKGKPETKLKDGLLPIVGKSKETGTEITFMPDAEIFTQTTRFSATDISSRLHETAYLNPSLTIFFKDLRGDEPTEETYHEPEGLLGFVRDLNKEKDAVSQPFLISGTAGDIPGAGTDLPVDDLMGILQRDRIIKLLRDGIFDPHVHDQDIAAETVAKGSDPGQAPGEIDGLCPGHALRSRRHTLLHHTVI